MIQWMIVMGEALCVMRKEAKRERSKRFFRFTYYASRLTSTKKAAGGLFHHPAKFGGIL